MNALEEEDQAARWLARLHSPECSEEERVACGRWRAADPRHEVAYRQAESLYLISRDFGAQPRYRAAARVARERAERERRRRQVWRRGGVWALAATLVLALGLGWYRWDPAPPEQRYVTAVGERRSLSLEDGSRVELDTDSVIAVRYGRRSRGVVLLQGRAQFDVAHAPQRPFTVEAGEGSVRAIGTRFQVRRQREAVQVTLLEGSVAVQAPAPMAGHQARSATLSPGETLRYGPQGVWQREPADLDTVQGWTRGELRFRQRPLRELLDEANRYARVQVRIGDVSLAQMPVSGVFASNDQTSLLQALEHVLPLRIERTSADEIVLRQR